MKQKHTNIKPTEVVEHIYKKLEEILIGRKLTSDNIISVVVLLMQSIEIYNKLNGTEKKNIIIQVLKRFLDDKIENTEEANHISVLVKETVPHLIDTLIAVNKKKLVIKNNKTFSKIYSCCR